MATATVTTRKQPAQAHGTARWLVKPDVMGRGILVINGTTYEVSQNRDNGRLVGYVVENIDSGAEYDIDAKTWVCDCPDATYRGRRCKHSAALDQSDESFFPDALSPERHNP